MSTTLRDLRLRVRALFSPRQVERELDDELAFHIECETAKYVERGVPLDEARTRARARFGSVALAADECRDARGIGLLDALARDVHYALRTFRRAPLAALTIVVTVALGLGLVASAFTLFNAVIFQVDAVRDPHELFGVRRPVGRTGRAWLPFTRPEYEALRRDTSVFTGAAAMVAGVGARIDGRPMNGHAVTGNFFQMLGVRAALGRTLVPDDDERGGGRQVIVLSHRGWKRVGSDPAAIGRTVLINGSRYEIVGVMPDGFRGLGIAAPDFWAPLSLIGRIRPTVAGKEDQIDVDIVGRLKPGMTPDLAAAALTAWGSGHLELKSERGQPSTFRLRPRQGTVADDAREVLLVFAPIFFAFGLVLMIGCANAANLLLARGVARQREIGIRLSLGASRMRIVRQLLTESLLLALLSAAGGFAISRFVLDAAIYAATTTMPAEIAENLNLAVPAADWRVGLFLIGAAAISTVLFGLAPALQATRLELVRTMRGEVMRDARPGHARSVLIAVQVGASALLLICAAVFLRSAMISASADTGVRVADTLGIELENEAYRPAVLQALLADPVVARVAASRPHALAIPPTAFATGETRIGVGYKFVSPEFFGVLDVPVLRGRGFAPHERTADAGVAVVSDTAAHLLWADGAAPGRVLEMHGPDGRDAKYPRSVTVVGVVRDVRGSRLSDWPAAMVYLPTAAGQAGTTVTVQVYGDPVRARAELLERITRVDPSLKDIWSLRVVAQFEAYFLQTAFWVSVVLGGLALVLTLSGLFSVLSYLVEQRRQEIGVRMALGATAREVIRLVLSQTIWPVAVGLIVGTALTGSLASVLLATPIAKVIGHSVHVFDPAAYAVSLACIVLACIAAASIPARRAARIDPMTTLRME